MIVATRDRFRVMRETPYSDSIVARVGDGAEKEKSPVPVIRFRRRRRVSSPRSRAPRAVAAPGRAVAPSSRPRSRLRPRSRERSRRLPFPYGRSSRRSSRLGPPRSGPPRPRSRERERERGGRVRARGGRASRRGGVRRARLPAPRARYRPLIASSIRSSARYRRFLSTPKMSTSSSFPSGSSRSGVKKQNVFVSRSIERSVALPEPCTRPAAPRGCAAPCSHPASRDRAR